MRNNAKTVFYKNLAEVTVEFIKTDYLENMTGLVKDFEKIKGLLN